MIRSLVFCDGQVISHDLDVDALRVVRADKGFLVWVDLSAPTPEENKAVLENLFAFHPLAIEDCLSFSQMPKIEDFEEYLFIVMHCLELSEEKDLITSEIDVFLGKSFLVTHHTREFKFLQELQDRLIRHATLPVRGPDRVAHMVFNNIISHYKPVADRLSIDLEELEDAILGPEKTTGIQAILDLRRRFTDLRRVMRPQVEIIHRLSRGGSPFLRTHLLPYYRDLYDQLVRIEDRADHDNERLMLDFDVYMNRTANEANEGIKVLTSLTAITLPPVLVGTWYGMNFHSIPEFEAPHAYLAVILFTLSGMLGMFIWLRSKKWF